MGLNNLEKGLLDQLDGKLMMQHTTEISRYDRVSGGPGERQAMDYLISVLEREKIPHQVHGFDAYLSHPGKAQIVVMGRDGTVTPLLAKARAFSGSTPAGGATGETVWVEGGKDMFRDFDTWRVLERMDLSGKIVVSEGGGRLNMITAQRRGALAYIHVWPKELPFGRVPEGVVNPVWGTPEPGDADSIPAIPVVSVGKQHAGLIQSAAAVKVESTVCTGWMPVRVVVAHISPGAAGSAAGSLARQFVLVHGHMDSWHLGATDNATGNALCLEVARVLHRNSHLLTRGVRVAWWPGHSAGRYAGSAWYADAFYNDLFRDCLGHINIDSPGMQDAVDLSEVVCAAEAAGFSCSVVEDLTGVRPHRTGPTRSSDQSFWGAGVPSVFLTVSHVPGGAWWWHTEDDTIDKADWEFLLRDARTYLLGTYRLATCEVLSFDFEAASRELLDALAGLERSAGDRFDFSGLRASLEHIRVLATALGDQIRPSSEIAALDKLNDALLRSSRAITRLAYTLSSPYHPDPAVPMRLMPGMSEAARLEGLNAGCDDSRFLLVRLVRERNRAAHLLDTVEAALRDALQCART